MIDKKIINNYYYFIFSLSLNLVLHSMISNSNT